MDRRNSRRRSRSRSRSQPPQERSSIRDDVDDIIVYRIPPSLTHRIDEFMGRRQQQALQASQGPHQPNSSNQDQSSGNGTGNENSYSNVQNWSKSEDRGRPKSRGPPTNDNKTQNEPKSQTGTDAKDDGIDEIVPKTKRIRWFNAICCWCGQKGHRAVRCPGPPDQATGQIHACAFCNSRAHISEQCKDNFDADNSKDWDELERIMLVTRRNLPMLACSVAPNAWPRAQPGQKYENCRPWTGDYAFKYETGHPDYAKNYVVNKSKEDDADLGADPWWANPISELRYRLFVPKPIRVVDSEFVIFKKRRWDDQEMTDANPSKKVQRKEAAESNIGSIIVPEGPAVPQSFSTVHTNSQQEQRRPTFDITGSFMKTCTNCGDKEHESKDCQESCGNCRSHEHTKDDCIEPHEFLCVCQPFPQHLSANCPIECNSPFCFEEPKHQAVLCTKQCCQCGVTAIPDLEDSPPTRGLQRHVAIDCPLKRTECSHCHGNHVTAQCPSLMTDYPEACKSKDCGIWYCETHCQKCFFNGHKRDKCPNTVIVKADQSFALKCPSPSHPEMVLGDQEHCPACRSDRVAALKARGGHKGGNRGGRQRGGYQNDGNRGGGQQGGHQNGGNLGNGGGQGKGTGGNGGNRGGGGGGVRGGLEESRRLGPICDSGGGID